MSKPPVLSRRRAQLPGLQGWAVHDEFLLNTAV